MYGVEGGWGVSPDDERAHGKDERIPVPCVLGTAHVTAFDIDSDVHLVVLLLAFLPIQPWHAGCSTRGRREAERSRLAASAFPAGASASPMTTRHLGQGGDQTSLPRHVRSLGHGTRGWQAADALPHRTKPLAVTSST